jgi:alkanesulfonate monooxygenase SsuD/methylene tetrahydromethanopterin reductase-like flavin-dependent oxidoreductase (luciferase family)
VTVVDVQLSPAHNDWAALREDAQAAEALGFGAIWVYDHLAGLSLDGDRMLECFTLLGALTELTSSIELGALVANVWNRQVGTLVSAAASVAIMSGRRFHLGLGAGASPTSKWSTEQLAVAAELAASIEERHARVEAVLDLAERQWRPDRDPIFATFPLPSPAPSIILGVNSVRLGEIAGRRADGVNVPWRHPRRDELLAAASTEAASTGRPFVLTVWTRYAEELLDPEHPQRVAMEAAGIDRLILSVLGGARLSR